MTASEKLQEIKYWTSLDGSVLYIDNEEIAAKIKGEFKLQLIKDFNIVVNVKKSLVTINKCEVQKKMCSVFAKILDIPFIAEQAFNKNKLDPELQNQQKSTNTVSLSTTVQEKTNQGDVEPNWQRSPPNKKRQPVRRPEVSIEENLVILSAKTSAIKATKEQIAAVLCLDPNIDFQRIIFKTNSNLM